MVAAEVPLLRVDLGKVVEVGPADDLFEMPRHPYTRALLSAVPTPDPVVRRRRILLAGEARSPVDPAPDVCRFSGRCPEGFERCEREMPPLRRVGEDHEAACHLLDAGAVPR